MPLHIAIEPAFGDELNIGPNPTTGAVRLSGEIHGFESIQIDLLDVQGRNCRKWVAGMQLTSGHIDQELDLSELARGVYFLRIRSGNELMVKKLIKQ